MKIIYCGIDVYLPVFEYLADSTEHEVVALYTYHEASEYIRDEKITAAAKRRKIPVTLERLSAQRLEEMFKKGDCDLLLSAEYDRKLPIPELSNFRGINIHNSLLPEGRGYFPVEMRIYKGYTYGGVTIHQLAEKVDRGDILLQEKFAILPEECSLDVYEKSSWVALAMMKKLLADFSRHWAQAQPQDEAKAVWWPLPKAEELTITSHMCLAEVRHIFRSFSYLTQLRIGEKIFAVRQIECQAGGGPDIPVQIDAQNAKITFGALDGTVRVTYREEAIAAHDGSEKI